MAAIGDYISAINTRLIDLHLANATWAALVKPGNRITRGSAPMPLKMSKQSADAPEWDFRVTRFVAGPQNTTTSGTVRTFGNTRSTSPPTCPAIWAKTYTFVAVIAHRDLGYDVATQLETLMEIILVGAGPKLSLSGSPLAYVNGWGPLSGEYIEKASPETGGKLALIQRITVPVQITITTADILGT